MRNADSPGRSGTRSSSAAGRSTKEFGATGFCAGYGVKTLPAVRESIEQRQWQLAEEQIVRVGKVLENAGEAIQGEP